MLEESELVNLSASIAAILILIPIARKIERGKLSFFYTAFGAMLLSFILTNLEVFFWYDFLNHVEHSLLAIAGILFAIGCWQLGQPEQKNSD